MVPHALAGGYPSQVKIPQKEPRSASVMDWRRGVGSDGLFGEVLWDRNGLMKVEVMVGNRTLVRQTVRGRVLVCEEHGLDGDVSCV